MTARLSRGRGARGGASLGLRLQAGRGQRDRERDPREDRPQSQEVATVDAAEDRTDENVDEQPGNDGPAEEQCDAPPLRSILTGLGLRRASVGSSRERTVAATSRLLCGGAVTVFALRVVGVRERSLRVQ